MSAVDNASVTAHGTRIGDDSPVTSCTVRLSVDLLEETWGSERNDVLDALDEARGAVLRALGISDWKP